jgi:hypothetical protein
MCLLFILLFFLPTSYSFGSVISVKLGKIPTTVHIKNNLVSWNLKSIQLLLEPNTFESLLKRLPKNAFVKAANKSFLKNNYLKSYSNLRLKFDPKKKRITPQKGFTQNFKGIPVWATTFEAQTIASKGKRGDFYMNRWDLGAALPSRNFLGKNILVYYPKTKKSVVVPVIDVGPWNTKDDWLSKGKRPTSEKGKDTRGRTTNKAGLDLSGPVWVELGIPVKKAMALNHSDYVEFVLLD